MSKRIAQPLMLGLLALAAPVLATELPRAPTDAMYAPVNVAEARLGQLLFWDPILSGNKNISCGTCHHPRFGTSDGLSLGIGEGGVGLGVSRRGDPANPPEQRIPRNAPALFNLGSHEFQTLFHDGRIETDPTRASGIRTPLDEDMVQGFSGVLSAQTMFPVLSQDEMAGHYSENDVSRAVRQGLITGQNGAWGLIAARVAAIPEYQRMFSDVYSEIRQGRPIAFTDISNAIAGFMAHEWRSDDSALDAFLRGQSPLPQVADKGMGLFYGKAGCGTCHSGPFQTDHQFHAMGLPQIGPGKSARFENHARDVGRMRVTGKAEDAYAFRTPSLRNVVLTAPYGHDGAYASLAKFVSNHPGNGGKDYNPADAILPPMPAADDWRLVKDEAEISAIASAVKVPRPSLSKHEVDLIVAFLGVLTGKGAAAGRLGIPATVPSGLPVDR